MTTDISPDIGIAPDDYTEAELVLLDLEKKHNGLTPQIVVWEASRENSPLHPYFTWDNERAADERRLDQAGALIRRLKVKMIKYQEETETPLRALLPVRRLDDDGIERPYYLHVEKVLKSEDMRRQMLDRAKKELAAFRNKYAVLSELNSVFDALDALSA